MDTGGALGIDLFSFVGLEVSEDCLCIQQISSLIGQGNVPTSVILVMSVLA